MSGQLRLWQRPGPLVFLIALTLLLCVRPTAAQQLGSKLLGGLGVDAGAQAEPGFYLLDRFLYYRADRVYDRAGRRLPIDGLAIDVYGNMLGASFTVRPQGAPFLSFAAGLPLARVSINSDHPTASVDVMGVSDIFVQPLKLGLRRPQYDVVASYVFYAPTGRFEPRGLASVGRGYWTHQFSLGGLGAFDRERTIRASALASLDINMRKRDIDITRGNMFQVQGGAGVTVQRVVTLGLAGFALWQVSEDRGSDLPPALQDVRTRVFGLGPEIDLLIPRWRTRLELRWEHEFAVRSRTAGSVFVAGLAYRIKSGHS